MTLQDLSTWLATCDVLSLKGDEVRVGPHALHQAFQAQVLDPFYGTAGLEVRDAKLQLQDNPDKVLVTGKALVPLLAGTETAEVEISFELLDQGESLGVTIGHRLPASWQFQRSFPNLPLGYDESSQRHDLPGQPSALDATFALTGCHFFLTTHEHQHRLAGGSPIGLKPGLNVVGRWSPGGALGFAAHVMRGAAGDLVAQGHVVPAESPLATLRAEEFPWDSSPRIPGIHLEVPLSSGFSFPPGSDTIKLCNLRLQSYSPLSPEWALEDAAYAPVTAYLGDVVIPALRDTRLMTVSARATPGLDDELVFACQFIELDVDKLLRAAEAMVGGQDLRSLLPESIRSAIGKLGPQSASMTLVRLDPKAGYQVASTQLTIGMGAGARPWSLFGGLVKLEFETAKLAVVRPFDGQHRSVFSTIKGTVEFLGVRLGVQLETPALYLSAQQIGTARFDLKGYFEGVARMPWPGFLPEQVELVDMALQADPATYYAFSMSLGVPYRLRDGDQEYALPNLRLAVSYQQTEGAKQRLRWQFEAATKPGEPAVPVAVLVEKMAQGLGAQLSLPKVVRRAISVERAVVSYSAWNARTTFECWGRIVLNTVALDCSFTVEHTPEKRDLPTAPSRTAFGGRIVIAPDGGQRPLSFGLRFAKDGESNHCVAAYSDEYGSPIKIRNLASRVFPRELAQLVPESLELALKSAFIAYSQDTAHSTDGVATDAASAVLFGVDVGARINLSDLPVVGGALPKDAAIGFESLRVMLASAAFSGETLQKLDGLLPAGMPSLAHRATAASTGRQALTKGFNVSATLLFGLEPTLLTLPVLAGDTAPASGTESPSTAELAVDQAAQNQGAAGATKWFDVDRSLGPLTLRRIGLDYEASRVGIRFDASLQLSVLTFNLEGLGLTYALGGSTDPSEIAKNLSFTLDGMGLSLGNGPIEIGGSLARISTGDAALALEGTLLIRTVPFTFSALGSYADVGGSVSVMAFAVLLRELGDPTGSGAFVVTGLAFGFGLNRKLRLPLIDDVGRFPLVQAAMGKQDLQSLGVLPAQLRHHVSPHIGSFWLAAGIKFNSFGMVDSFLLVSVSWGVEVEIGLLGLSRMTVPPMVQPEQAIAGAELSLRGVVRIAEGLIQFEARLTENSFIFSRNCRLTGGFAFCMWFKGAHAGDFVLSLGGYHPAFMRPAHYPLVPRLGMHLQIGSELSITGEAYFALTPFCVMAGGRLCAVYKSGGVEAWFIAYADFLINWQPFYYQATIGISLGIALRLGAIAIRLELGVDLKLQGPPFGGEALVRLWIISFTIPFGTMTSAPPPLTARRFAQTCLPAPKRAAQDQSPDIFSVRVTAGLLREQEIEGQNRSHRVVNAHQLCLVAQSVVPCTAFAGLGAGLVAAGECGILPMGKKTLQSVFTVTATGIQAKNVKVSAVTGKVPQALWGRARTEGVVTVPALPDATKPDTGTQEVTLGIRIAPIPQTPVHPLPAMGITKFAFADLKKKVDWGHPAAVPERPVPRGGRTIFNTIESDDDGLTGGRSVVKRRQDILACLRKLMPPDRELHEPSLKGLINHPDYFQVSHPEQWSLDSPP